MFPDYSNSVDADVPAYVWEERAGKVKAAFLHAYHGYEKYAAPRDELLPLSKEGINKYGRLATVEETCSLLFSLVSMAGVLLLLMLSTPWF